MTSGAAAGHESEVWAMRIGMMKVLGALGLLVGGLVAMPASTNAVQTISVRNTPLAALLAKLKDPAATANDYFGDSVAVSGKTAVIGASGTGSNNGAAYIYVEGTSGWPTTPTATLSDPAAFSGDSFGWSVAVSGKTAVVGAYGTYGEDGAAYVYVEGTSGWPKKPTATLSDPAATADDSFGISVSVSGRTAIVGASGTGSNTGAAYIYVEGTSGWPTTPTATLKNPIAPRKGFFGSSVAVSGTTAVVGATFAYSNKGAAYTYVVGASGWPTTPTVTLMNPNATVSYSFGWSVAVSGKTAIVGADGSSSNTGAAYIYVEGTSGWPTTPTATLSDPAATKGDGFGGSVAVSGKRAVVGAYASSSNTAGAYIYVKGASGWPTTPTTAFTDPKATEGDAFGGSVADSGKTAIVGAEGTNSEAGAAYIYKA